MKLENYLQRIHYTGPLAPTEATLRQLHRAHLLAIPYENLDIHLGRRLTLEIEHVYTKIVDRGRGGWCYEMNGLFAWALRELGFDVTLLGSSVGEPAQGADGDQGVWLYPLAPSIAGICHPLPRVANVPGIRFCKGNGLLSLHR